MTMYELNCSHYAYSDVYAFCFVSCPVFKLALPANYILLFSFRYKSFYMTFPPFLSDCIVMAIHNIGTSQEVELPDRTSSGIRDSRVCHMKLIDYCCVA